MFSPPAPVRTSKKALRTSWLGPFHVLLRRKAKLVVTQFERCGSKNGASAKCVQSSLGTADPCVQSSEKHELA